MINIKINNSHYTLPSLESELTPKQKSRIKRHAPSIRNANKKTLQNLLCILTGVDNETAGAIARESLQTLWREYIAPLTEQVSPQKEIKTFMWNGEPIVFPLWGFDLNGDNIPLVNITAKQFCEASDLMNINSEKYKYLITAILCDTNKETFDEQLLMESAKKLKGLPGQITYKIMAELKLAHRYMKTIYKSGYPQSMSWNDLMFSSAAYLPSEIKLTGQLDCYEFMKLADSRIKSNYY